MSSMRQHIMARERCKELEKERKVMRNLLERCRENLDPHRDAVLWGEVYEILKVKS